MCFVHCAATPRAGNTMHILVTNQHLQWPDQLSYPSSSPAASSEGRHELKYLIIIPMDSPLREE